MLCLRNSNKLFTVRNKSLVSKFHELSSSESADRKWEEVRIPVPWGHVAGKWWGPQDKRPIFALHGWQDNCGSFDRLIPMLSGDQGYLAVDFPGHGLSSQLPDGVFYHITDATIFIKRIQEYFEWEKISLLGHSMGAVMGFMYTCLFPESVDMLVCLDAFKPNSQTSDKYIKNSIKNVEQFLRYDRLNSATTRPPTYTYDELVRKFHLGTNESVEPENCKYILDRSVGASTDDENKYFFKRDSRLKIQTLVGMPHGDILEQAKRIVCPMMVVKSIGQHYYQDKKYFYDVIDVLRQNEKFEYQYVKGTHHVHLNNPERIAKLVNQFLLKHNIADRGSDEVQNINLEQRNSL